MEVKYRLEFTSRPGKSTPEYSRFNCADLAYQFGAETKKQVRLVDFPSEVSHCIGVNRFWE